MRKQRKKLAAAVCLGTVVLAMAPTSAMAEMTVHPVPYQQEESIAPYMLYIND